jgi:Lar family restriction alleviation protein
MMEELKPCPFCGEQPYNDEETAKYFGKMTGWNYAIACSNCEAKSMGFTAFKEACKEWNTRHVPEGYALVPVDPTDGMTFIGQSMRYESLNSIGAIYKAMIAAAQEKE